MEQRKKREKRFRRSGMILTLLLLIGFTETVFASGIKQLPQLEPVLPEVSEEQSGNIVSTEKPEEIENGFIVYHYVRFFDGAAELTGLADSVLPEEDIVFPKLPVRKFHRGIGWSLEENGTRAEYYPGDRIKADDMTAGKEPVFYAVYEKTGCTLTFEDAGTELKTETLEEGARYIMPELPEKIGYRSAGWAEDPDAESAEYISGKSYLITEDMTLYPVWQKVYTISFRTNNGKATDRLNILTMTGIRGEKMTLPEIPVYSGYTPVGWSIYSNSGAVSYKAGSTYMVTGNRIFYQVNVRSVQCPFMTTVEFPQRHIFAADKSYIQES